MTAPAGLTRLAPPPSLLSPAPSATLSPPLSEPDQQQQRLPEVGGRLSFFGRDGHVLLELSHGPLETWERQKRWVAVSRKPFWPPVTVAAPVGTIDAHHAVGQSSRQSPRPAGRKQPTPGRRSAGHLFCGGRGREAAPPGSGPSTLCLRRLGRRPCGAAPQPPAVVPLPARRAARLADTVRRLAERRQRPASHSQRCVTLPATPRKRCQAVAARTARGTPRPSPAAAAAAAAAASRQSTVHSIDSLLSTQSHAAPQPATPPVVVPTPVRPPPYAYSAYLASGGGKLCAVPPPAGCGPLPLLLARLSGGLMLPVQTRPSPAHSTSGWYAAAIDYSQSVDEPLNLSKR